MPDSIILIDAYSQIYRAFYAIRNLSNSQGQPSNAVFGIARFLLKINKKFPAEHGAFVFDKGKPAFRLELAPEYKANRPPMPEDLKSQIPYLKRMIAAFGWPEISLEGFEADDLIAAIADITKSDVRIISSDKDLHQLVNDRVKMLVPDKEGDFEERGPSEVLEKFDVPPERIIDYLALIGDASDNIPGIQGIGPKTAAALIKTCGGIRDMIANPDLIPNPTQRDKIRLGGEILLKNLELIRLRNELDGITKISDDNFVRRQPDWNAVREIATELELKSLIRDIDAIHPEKVATEQPGKVQGDLFDML